MCEYMEKTTELAKRITEWGMRSGYNPDDNISGVARLSELKRRIERTASQARLPISRL